MSIRRKVLVANGVLAAALAGLVIAGVTSVFHTASAHPAVRTVTATMGTVSSSVTATGNVSPAQSENLNFATSGTVSEIDVSLGQAVTAGQVLAKLDPSAAQAALTAAQDQLTAAQDNLALARSGGETPPQKAQDQASLTAAQNQVTTDQSALTAAQNQLSADQSSCAKNSGSACNAVNSDQQAVTQAQNALTQAQNNLTQTQLSIQAKEYVNPAAVLQDEAAVTQTQQTVNQDQKVLSETVLTAPFSGTVTALNGSTGETVSGSGSSASSSTGSGSGSSSASGGSGAGTGSSGSGSSGSSSAFMTIANTSQLQVVAGFAEADATRISVGQPATVTFSALTSTSAPGQVTAVSPTSTVVSNVVTYQVTVALSSVPSSVKAGMTASVAVVVASANNVLELPTSAVTTTGRVSTVTLLKNGKQSTQVVTTGLVGDTTTQILTGLSVGDVVVEPTVSVTGAGTGATGRTGGFGGIGGGGFGGFGGGAVVRGGGG